MLGVGIFASMLLAGWAISEIIDDGDDSSNDDDVEVTSEEETITEGSEEDDLLYGTDGADLLVGGEGEDHMRGLDDDDMLFGSEGDDFVRGGDGDDALFGNEGADTLQGASGNDMIDSTSLLDYQAFLDSIETATQPDDIVVDYRLEEDTDAGDVVDGGNGDDVLLFGSDDTVEGGSGSDTFSTGFWVAPDAPATVLDFDKDEDLLTYSYIGATPPEITTSSDVNGTVEVLANGQTVMYLVDVDGAVDASDIVLVREDA